MLCLRGYLEKQRLQKSRKTIADGFRHRKVSKICYSNHPATCVCVCVWRRCWSTAGVCGCRDVTTGRRSRRCPTPGEQDTTSGTNQSIHSSYASFIEVLYIIPQAVCPEAVLSSMEDLCGAQETQKDPTSTCPPALQVHRTTKVHTNTH